LPGEVLAPAGRTCQHRLLTHEQLELMMAALALVLVQRHTLEIINRLGDGAASR
jgi:hypothetical protein